MDLINRNALARPPLGLDKEEQQLVTWKSLIAWEKTNPLQLDVYSQRILFTFKQAFMALRFYPEIWYVPPPLFLEAAVVANLKMMSLFPFAGN